MNIGLVGLGSMGFNLAKNIISKKYSVYAYEKNEVLINALRNNHIQNLILNNSLEGMLSNLPSPRIVMLSLQADKIDDCINELIKYLKPNDIIADLGNSLYLKSIQRYELLRENNISFLGIGVSGGPRGAKNGPAIMAGGSKHAWENVNHIFEDIAAKKDNKKACCFFGGPGSGHFVKLVHNGIEYALMEALAEISVILRQAHGINNEDQTNIFNKILKTLFKLCFLISRIFNSSLNIIPGFRFIIKRHLISAIPRPSSSKLLNISFSNILLASKKLFNEILMRSSRR